LGEALNTTTPQKLTKVYFNLSSSEKGQTKNHSTANNIISPNTVAVTNIVPIKTDFEITATTQREILFTASLH